MVDYDVDVQIELEEAALPLSAQDLAQIVQRVLEHEQQPPHAGVTLVLTGDEQIRTLNRTYRATDSATDVLSFPANEVAEAQPAFITPQELPPYLGDVIVSYPTAQAQAAQAGHPVEAELALLIVHGCLHLLGYDHATDEEQRVMWARQDAILQSLKT